MQILTDTHFPDLPLLSRGKVRDMFAIDAESLLIVTTDRMSAFDVIMQEPIPYKGVVLNQITNFWMQHFSHIIDNHLLETEVCHFPAVLRAHAAMLEGRSVLVKRAQPLPIECIVRGYLAGSGWKDYQRNGSLCGYSLPTGLQESSKLPMPLFTPSTKAEMGEHDANIDMQHAATLVGEKLLREVETVALRIFCEAQAYALKKGIIIADTKFEFGIIDGKLTLIDEVLTPDSSRFWSAAEYVPGRAQDSFDKQYLRDWLETQDWDKSPPAPVLPAEVIAKTAAKYHEAYTILTGQKLNVEQFSIEKV